MYRFPCTASRLQSETNPQAAQAFPSGPISINFPFRTRNSIMDKTAEGWASMARLISKRLKPFRRCSNSSIS